MELGFKALWQYVTITAATLILISLLVLFGKYAAARNVAYAVTEYVETHDAEHIDNERIAEYCGSKGMACSLEQITSTEGITANGEDATDVRWKVTVGFSHPIAVLAFQERVNITVYSRIVTY